MTVPETIPTGKGAKREPPQASLHCVPRQILHLLFHCHIPSLDCNMDDRLVFYHPLPINSKQECQAGKASFSEHLLCFFSLRLSMPQNFFSFSCGFKFKLIRMCALYIFHVFSFPSFSSDAVGVLSKSLCLKALYSQLFL